MKTVSMLEFRKRASAILKQVGKGQAYILTHRGKPAARLEPIEPPQEADPKVDSIYRLYELASPTLEPLTNEQMDELIYGK